MKIKIIFIFCIFLLVVFGFSQTPDEIWDTMSEKFTLALENHTRTLENLYQEVQNLAGDNEIALSLVADLRSQNETLKSSVDIFLEEQDLLYEQHFNMRDQIVILLKQINFWRLWAIIATGVIVIGLFFIFIVSNLRLTPL